MSDNDIQDSGEADRIIAEELQRLLESPMFVRSPVLSRLLQYLADHRLRGGRTTPKAYAIATEALGRSADFDPAVDSYPRVMVGRLRTLLDRYYSETPWVHRLRVPQGSYEVVVQYRASPPGRSDSSSDNASVTTADAMAAGGATQPPVAPAPASSASQPARGGYGWVISVLVFVVALYVGWQLLGSAGRYFSSKPIPMPVVEVSAPQSGETAVSRAMARALDGKLRDGIRRFGLVQLQSRRQPGTRAPEPDYRLDSSIVRTVEGPVDVTLVLNRAADQRTIWSHQFRVAHQDIPAFTTVEPAIAQIAGDFGMIVRDQVQRQPNNFATGFPCLAQFNRLRQMRQAATARRVEACLRETLVQDPLDPIILASLSLLRFGDWQPLRGTPAGNEAFAEARELAERAYHNGSNSSAGLFAMARANFYAGNCSAGNTLGGAAVRFNPYDPDIAGFLGLYKVACGQAAEGEAMLQRSLDLDASFPGVPAVTLAFLMSQRGEQDEAMAVLDNMPSPSNMEPQYKMVRAIVTARQGDSATARRLWKELVAYTKQPADAAPETVLRQFIITPSVIARSSEALRDSGVVAAKSPR